MGLAACATPNDASPDSKTGEAKTESSTKTDDTKKTEDSKPDDKTVDNAAFSLDTAKQALACMTAAGDTSFSNGLSGQISLQEQLPSDATLKAMQTQIKLYNDANDPDC